MVVFLFTLSGAVIGSNAAAVAGAIGGGIAGGIIGATTNPQNPLVGGLLGAFFGGISGGLAGAGRLPWQADLTTSTIINAPPIDSVRPPVPAPVPNTVPNSPVPPAPRLDWDQPPIAMPPLGKINYGY